MQKVFDGHNDILLRLHMAPERRSEIFLTGEGKGHLDLPRMQAGGFAGGMFAIYVPSPYDDEGDDAVAGFRAPPYDMPLPELIHAPEAIGPAMHQAGLFHWMVRASGGAFRHCLTVKDIRAAVDAGAIAGVLHMEGAEAIGADLDALHLFHAVGMRSLGPVWSRPTIFGHGVPFRFPADPDTGPGLTPAGEALVRECNSLRIMLDLSHLNAAGFRDVMRVSDAPLVATHSNAHAICHSTRNLTDWQLDAIAESDGMVGLNFAVGFLRPDGLEDPNFDWDVMMRHLDHLISRLGENRVGFGSDFDGAMMPAGIADVEGLPRLVQACLDHQFGAELVEKLAFSNWMRVLEKTWGK
ncbi:dipeptidase [Xinfangfangia sp. CPCC 101601]|uniref:Dipeptidase n=1 Tax=Pseudogemmobacter lacusdianii TaxID=3069608 RepID=A0ABU0VY83_9RHOB|nr:dipeptidase [Xinfangfangia sp. CPCC 101601]MDQ2066692.1 dipeptidase [Xinfangfangia sp. CPCC 101601]